MNAPSLVAVQRAVYTALSGDTGLVALLGAGKVFDWVPETTNYPYVNVGDDTSKDYDSQSFHGLESTVVIHSWSRTVGGGRKEIKTIMDRIYQVLHEQVLPMVSGQIMILSRCEFATTLLDPDGVTYHGVQRFRILTQGV